MTLVAIGSGLIAVGGMFASRRLPITTALFLLTTVLTSVTGFFFPIYGFTPALGVGGVSCVILAIALFAYYGKGLGGAWRWIYVVTAIAALYLNVFVIVVQSFVKVAGLNALARQIGAAVRDHAGGGLGDFCSDRDCCAGYVSAERDQLTNSSDQILPANDATPQTVTLRCSVRSTEPRRVPTEAKSVDRSAWAVVLRGTPAVCTSG